MSFLPILWSDSSHLNVTMWPIAEVEDVFWTVTVRRKTGPNPCTFTGDRQINNVIKRTLTSLPAPSSLLPPPSFYHTPVLRS